MLKTNEIRIRDPFIVAYENTYYMYGTHEKMQNDKNLYVFKSTDLENWEDAKTIFTLAHDSWAIGELWAPEVHLYEGRFYLFISILGKHGLRGTQICVCDTPDGTFLPISDRPATPFEKSCIDGTLHVENGRPYIVYSADWPDNFDSTLGVYVGEIKALELTKDLKNAVGEPFLIFRSADAPCSKNRPAIHDYMGNQVTRYGSDGPFIRKLKNGSLMLTWSPIPDLNYVVAYAISKSGSIKGPWIHGDSPLFDKNGGHAMIFDDFDQNTLMCIHFPERYPDERAFFLKLDESGDSVSVK